MKIRTHFAHRIDMLDAAGKIQEQTLEYYMARTTLRCAEKFKNPLSGLFNNVAFVQRREAFYESLTWPSVPRGVREAGVKLIDRIKLAEQNRHTIITAWRANTQPQRDPSQQKLQRF
jgi:hypothetical protein